MYSTEQLSGMLLTLASCKFSIVNVKNSRGWEARFFVYIRPPATMLQAVCDTLDMEEIHYSIIRERGRRIDTILIRRRHSVFRICEIFPAFVPSKNKGWDKFKVLMDMIKENKHLEEDSKYYFEAVLNEDKEETENNRREVGNRKDH